MYCYLNGAIIPEEEAKVGILDIGLLRGYGIYEAMAAIGGKVFRWADHSARFKKSAAFLNISIPVGDEGMRRIISELATKNGLAVEERDYATDEFFAADEAFLTSSFKDVVPVVAVDDRTVGSGSVGRTTKKITRLFDAYLAAY